MTRCLSGNTAEAIQNVDPQFIQVAKIQQSLTPGRNNGFLNMLKSMKQKALDLAAAAKARSNQSSLDTTYSEADRESESPDVVVGGSGGGPKYNEMIAALRALKPSSLSLIDNSHQHAGHAGNDMDGESHFELNIVAEAFDGLNLVKRHKLVYMILGDIMPRIHALQIQAMTPEEAAHR
jgi:BolA-like protein 1